MSWKSRFLSFQLCANALLRVPEDIHLIFFRLNATLECSEEGIKNVEKFLRRKFVESNGGGDRFSTKKCKIRYFRAAGATRPLQVAIHKFNWS